MRFPGAEGHPSLHGNGTKTHVFLSKPRRPLGCEQGWAKDRPRSWHRGDTENKAQRPAERKAGSKATWSSQGSTTAQKSKGSKQVGEATPEKMYFKIEAPDKATYSPSFIAEINDHVPGACICEYARSKCKTLKSEARGRPAGVLDRGSRVIGRN